MEASKNPALAPIQLSSEQDLPEILLSAMLADLDGQRPSFLHPNSNAATYIGRLTLDCLEDLSSTETPEERERSIVSALTPLIGTKADRIALGEFINSVKETEEKELAASGLRRLKSMRISNACLPNPNEAAQSAPRKLTLVKPEEKATPDFLIGKLDGLLRKPKLPADVDKRVGRILGEFRDFDTLVGSVSEFMTQASLSEEATTKVLRRTAATFIKGARENLIGLGVQEGSELMRRELVKWLAIDADNDFIELLQPLIIKEIAVSTAINPNSLFDVLTRYVMSDKAKLSVVESVTMCFYEGRKGILTPKSAKKTLEDRRERFFNNDGDLDVSEEAATRLSVEISAFYLSLLNYATRESEWPLELASLEQLSCGCERCTELINSAQEKVNMLAASNGIEQ